MANSANLIVDLGNGAIKFKSKDKRGKFKSTIERTDELCEIKNTVVYDNKAYVLGYGGSYDREFNKVKKENWIYQLLLALNLGTTAQEVNVCLLLPTSQSAFKEEYLGKLKNKMFKYKVENKNVVKNIKKVLVLNEGAVGYKALGVKQGNTLVLDLGSRTMNIVMVDGDGNVIKKITEAIGVFDYYCLIKERLNSITGENYTEEDIDELITNSNKLYTDLKGKDELLKEFLYNVLGKVKGNGIKLGMFDNIWGIGGGFVMLKNLLKNTPIKTSDEYANVEGAYNIIKGIWK